MEESAASTKPTQIEHVDDVFAVLKALHLSESYADVVFVVQGERIHAHRAILAARSEYFRGLLFGGLAEAQQREINLNFELEPFKEMLLYIYTGCLSIATTAENISKTLGILKLADFLNLPKLASELTNLVERDLALENVTAVLEFAATSGLDELSSACLALMDARAWDYMQHESFKALSKASLEKILQRDSFAAPEVEIFRAVMRWYEENPIAENKSVFRHIRLSVMANDEIVNVVEPTKVFGGDEMFAAIVARTRAKHLPYRHCMVKNKMISFVPISTEDIAVVELPVTSFINHIHAELTEIDRFGYTVEVCGDNIYWEQIIDYSKFLCESTQKLYFEPRQVRCIKFGWKSIQPQGLNMKTSYAVYSDDVPELVNGIIAPIENVITNDKARFERCTLVEGLISTATSAFITLNQPYHIGSLRFSEQNCDYLSALIIYTSIDYENWELAYRGEGNHNWNHVTFEPRTVLFVKIDRPRRNTHLMGCCSLKLEMPSQDPDFVAQQLEIHRLKAAQL